MTDTHEHGAASPVLKRAAKPKDAGSARHWGMVPRRVSSGDLTGPRRPIPACLMAPLVQKLLLATLAAALICAAPVRTAGATETDVPAGAPSASPDTDAQWTSLKLDIKAYYTAPVRWDRTDWAWFGAAVVATGAAHHYDTEVRAHFVTRQGATYGQNTKDLKDAAPAAAVFLGTWLYAGLIDSAPGRHEAWDMVEAGALSGVTAYALKFAAGRKGPGKTSDVNAWREGGTSFPSFHTTAAFAVGTVLAESGNDEYRWLRRLLGYGLGAGTSYLRLKHGAHWLSDTVAGAALGVASAHFVLNRGQGPSADNHVTIVPVNGGAMLTYTRTLN